MKRSAPIGIAPQKQSERTPVKKAKGGGGPGGKPQGKPAAQAKDNGSGGNRNEPFWDSGVPTTRHAFKVLCTDGLAAALIGERGAVKEEIQKESGAKLVFSNRQDYFPKTSYRVLGIYSDSEDCIFRVLEAVMHRIVEQGNEERTQPPPQGPELLGKEDGEYVYRLCVTKRMSSQIIGAGGANISAIRNDTGAKVFLENDTHMGHRMGRIIGQPESIVACLRKINEFVQWECNEDHFRAFAGLVNFGNKDEARVEECMREMGLNSRVDFKGPEKGSSGKGARKGQSEAFAEAQRNAAAGGSPNGAGSRGGPPGGGASWRSAGGGSHKGVDADLDKLAEDLDGFPQGTTQVAYLISCVLDASQVEALLWDGEEGADVAEGERRGYLRYAEATTDSQITLEDADGVDTQGVPLRRVSVTGCIPNVYTAQAMILMRTKQLAQEAWGEEEEWDEDEAIDDPELLLARINELQEQLQSVEGRKA